MAGKRKFELPKRRGATTAAEKLHEKQQRMIFEDYLAKADLDKDDDFELAYV